MKTAIPVLLPVLLIAGCGGMTASLEEEVVSSLQYDSVECAALAEKRQSLAARYGITGKGDELEPGKRPVYVPVGTGPFIPDLRGEKTRERKRAIGEVAAMDRSIQRRCEKE